MDRFIPWIIGGVVAYLLGAIPFGLLIARARGVDIRAVGSGNIGATNVFRCVGKTWGILAFACDFLKGLAGVLWVPLLAMWLSGHPLPPPVGLELLGGALAIAGHNWPLYLGFKGGKGVATSAGMLLALAPAGCAIALGVWVVVLLAWRIVSLASIAAALTLGVAAWPLYYRSGAWLLPSVLTLLALLAVVRHKGNIRRLLAGTEPRIRPRGQPGAPDGRR